MSTATIARPRATKTQSNEGFDIAWFQGKMLDLQLTQRAIARMFEPQMDPSALSRILHGGRKMQVHEAAVIARAFGVSLADVVEHAGIDTPRGTDERVEVAGWIDDGGSVHRRNLRGPRTVIRPPGVSADAEAYRRIGDNGQDGWVLYVSGTDSALRDCEDRLSIVRLADGSEELRYIKKGYGRNEYLKKLTPDGKEIPARFASGRPVIWIKCS